LGAISGFDAVAAAAWTAARGLYEPLRAGLAYGVGDLEARLIAELPEQDRALLCQRAAKSFHDAWGAFGDACP
jgi:hypothetical protein